MITNSGNDLKSVCYEYHELITKIVSNIDVFISNQEQDDTEEDSFITLTDEVFGFILAVDEKDDPLNDESCWIKANPSLGFTTPYKYIRRQVRAAKALPSQANDVLRLAFCKWVNAQEAWIARDVYERAEADFDPMDFKGGEITIGIDLSHKNDLTAIACFHAETNSLWVYYFTTQGGLKERQLIDKAPYDMWIKQGFLTATPGNTIQFEFVAKKLIDLHSDFRVKSVFYDAYAFDELEGHCSGFAMDFVQHPQGFRKQFQDKKPLPLWMPGSIIKTNERFLENRIRIRKCPITKWNASSAKFEENAEGNKKFSKQNSRGRIDGIVAAAMAIGGNDLHVKKENVYNKRGMIWLNE